MANKFVLKDADEAAREEGITQAVTGVERTTEDTSSTYDYTKSIYATQTGGATNREALLKRVGVEAKDFYKYYNDGGEIPSGYEETARVLSIESKRAAEYDRVVEGEIGYEDFLMDTYGRDLLKSQGVDLENPLYWYNRYKSGEYSSPLDNDTVYMSILEQADNLFKEEKFLQEINTRKVSETLIAEEVEALVGESITEETFAKIFPDMSEAVLKAFDDDIDTLLTYHKAGYLNGVFKPYVDIDGDGDYEYVLYTDGKLYKTSEEDQWLFSDAVQINYAKDDNGNYLLNEDGTRRVLSVEKGGLFGTSGIGQFGNKLVSSISDVVVGVIDIFGIGYSAIAGAIDPEKTFGDYYMSYEALKNSSEWRVLSLGTADSYMYDEGKEDTSQKIAGAIGTVVGIGAQVMLAVGTGGGSVALQTAAEAGKQAAKITAKEIAKSVGKVMIRSALTGLAGGAIGIGIASANGTDTSEGFWTGFGIGASLGALFGVRGVLNQGTASVGKNIAGRVLDTPKRVFQKFWSLGTRIRSGNPFMATTQNLTRWGVWSKSLESAAMLSVRDGLESYATLEAMQRVREAAGQEVMSQADMLGKAVLTGVMSFGVSTLLRAGQGNSLSSRVAALRTAGKGEAAFLRTVTSWSKRIGVEILDSGADILENILTMGISSWGRDADPDANMLKHIGDALKNPTQIAMSVYISANNHGLLKRVTGQSSLNSERYEQAVGTLRRFQDVPLSDTHGILELHLSKVAPDLRESAYLWYEDNIKTAYEQAIAEFKDAGEANVSEMTINLRALQIIDSKLQELTGEDSPVLIDTAKEYYRNKLKEAREKNQRGGSQAQKSQAFGEVGFYKKVLKNLDNPQKGLSIVGVIMQTYMKDNLAMTRLNEYNDLMLDIQRDYDSYRNFIKNVISGKASDQYKDLILGENNTHIVNLFSGMLKQILTKTADRIKVKDYTSYLRFQDTFLSDNFSYGPKLIEQALAASYQNMFKYYSNEMLELKDQEIDSLMQSPEYFSNGTFSDDTIITDPITGKKVYRVNPDLAAVLKDSGQLDKLIKFGLINQETDGSYTTILPKSAFIKFNKAKHNELQSNVKLRRIIKVLDLLADSFEKSFKDYDRPIIIRVDTTYKNSEGEEVPDKMYILPSYSETELVQNMSLVPCFVQCMMQVMAGDDLGKINSALVNLGVMYSQDTVTLTDLKDILTVEEETKFKQLGILSFLRYFDISEQNVDKIDSVNLTDRSRLLGLFEKSKTGEGPILTIKDLDDIAQSLQGTGEAAKLFGTEKIKKNINDLRIYVELSQEGKAVVEILNRINTKKGTKATSDEANRIKSFIVSCKETSPELFKALTDDNVFNVALVKFVEDINSQTRNFQEGHGNTGEIIVNTSRALSKHLQANGVNIPDSEVEELTRQIYVSLTGGKETEYVTSPLYTRAMSESTKYNSEVRKAKRALKKTEAYSKLSKYNQRKVINYLNRVLTNPEQTRVGQSSFIKFVNINPKKATQYAAALEVETEIIKAYQQLQNYTVSRFTDMYRKADGSVDYDSMYELYVKLDPKAIDKEKFIKHLQSKRVQFNRPKETIIKFLQSSGNYNKIFQPEATTREVSEEFLLDTALKALDLKYSEGTYDVNPTHIVTIDLTEFTSKEYADVIVKLLQEARKASSFRNDKFDADIRKDLGGLTPHHQKVIGTYLMKGTTKLQFNLRTVSGRNDYNTFMESTGYGKNAAHYKPEVAGVRYSESIERGVEVKIEVIDNGQKVEMTPLEVLNRIRDNITSTDENNPHRIKYVNTMSENIKEKYLSRVDAVAQDIVYFDDDTIIHNVHDLMVNMPNAKVNISGIGESKHSIGLSIKQGVSAGRLAKYLKTAQQTMGVDGTFDVALGNCLQAYSIAESLSEYFTDPKSYDVGIKQTFKTNGAYNNAIKTLADSHKLYNIVEDSKTRTLTITPNKLSKEAFFTEALRILNSGKTMDLRKIMPYFDYTAIGGGEFTIDPTGARIFKSGEYHNLTKGGTEFSSLGDTGNVMTALNYVMTRSELTLDEMQTLLTTTNIYKGNYDINKGKYEGLSGKTVSEIIEACRGSNNIFEKALVYALNVGKKMSEAQMETLRSITNDDNLNKALCDLSTRTYIGKLFDEYDGDVEKVYEALQKTDRIPIYAESDKLQEYSSGPGLHTSSLRTLETDNAIDHKSITLAQLQTLFDLTKPFNTDNPKQALYAAISENPLLNIHNALEIVDGKLTLKLDMLYRLGDDEIEALESIGIVIKNKDELLSKRDAFEETDIRSDDAAFIEMKAKAALENQASNSMTTMGFTETLSVLSRLAMNRLRKPSDKMYVKASSILTKIEDSRVENLIKAYIDKLNGTVMRTVNNYGSLNVFNFNNREALAEFIFGIKNGVDVLRDIPITTETGEILYDNTGKEIKLINENHLFKVAEAIMLYTNGVDYSAEYTNTFIYNRETGDIQPFSQRTQYDLDFGRQLSQREDIYGDDSKNLVLIRVNKNVFTDINNPENKIKLYDLSNDTVKTNLKRVAVELANDALETKYKYRADVPEDAKERLAYVYGKVLTRRDKYQRIVDIYQKRIGKDIQIPQEYVEKLFPMIENIQVSSDGLNLRQEAYLNTLHRNIIGDNNTVLTDPQLRELNDLAIYAITLTAMPENLQEAFLSAQAEWNSSTDPKLIPMKSAIDSYLKGDKETARRIIAGMNVNKGLAQQVEDIKLLTYTLMLNRLQGKDINAFLIKGKSFKNILEESANDAYEGISISTDGVNSRPIREVIEGNMIAFDTESAFKPGDNASNNYQDSLPTELSFVIASRNDADSNLVTRGISGKKLNIIIKRGLDNIEVLGNKQRDTLDPNTYYYTTQEALDRYKESVAKLSKGQQQIKIEDGNTITYIVDGTLSTANKAIQDIINLELNINNLGTEEYNFISYNGKNYDDAILTKLGIQSFRTNVDLYETLQKIYSGLVNDTTSFKQEHLEKLIDLSRYGDTFKDGTDHNADHDALVLLAIAQEFYEKIADVNDYTKALKYDIIDLAKLYFDSSKSDEVILKRLNNGMSLAIYRDDAFSDSEVLTKQAGYVDNDEFITKYNNYGDSLTNEILMETRNAYNDLLNDYELLSIKSKRNILLQDIAGKDLEFITKLTNPEFRDSQRNLITSLYNIVVKQHTDNDGNVTGKFLDFDKTKGVVSGRLMEVANIVTAAVNLYNRDKGLNFTDATREFFSLSNIEQVEIIRNLSLDKDYINNRSQSFVDSIGNFDITTDKSLDFDTIDSLFDNGYNSTIEEIRRGNRQISVQYQIANAVKPVFDKLFNDEYDEHGNITYSAPYKFLDDETKEELKGLLTTFYGQTKEQRERQLARDAQTTSSSKFKIINSIFNTLMFGEDGFEVDDRLSNQILSHYKERIKGTTTYEKIRLVPDTKYEDGTVYLSKTRFQQITGVTYEQALIAAYGKRKAAGNYIYMEVNRQPSFKGDVIHNVKVIVIDDKKAVGAMGMTLNTAQHFFMGDNDGDLVCLRYSEDICRFGDKISKVVNTPMEMLSGVTNNISRVKPATLPTNIVEATNKFGNMEPTMTRMLDTCNDVKADTDTKRIAIAECKAELDRAVEAGVLTKEQAKAYWAYNGVEEINTRDTGLSRDSVIFASYNTRNPKDSLLVKGLVDSKQLSAQYYNVMALRDTAGQIPKENIKTGQQLDLDNKLRPFVYTPLNLEPSTRARLDIAFADDTMRVGILDSLNKSINTYEKHFGIILDSVRALMTEENIANNIDNGSVFIASVIQTTQDIITTSDIYYNTIKDAYASSKATAEARQNEINYYNQLKSYAKSRGLTVPDEENLDDLSIFEIQNKSAKLLDDSLEINKVVSDYAGTFESQDNSAFEELMFNIAYERYVESENSNILYCDTYGFPYMHEDPIKNKTYINAKTFKVYVSDQVEESEIVATNYVRTRKDKPTVSNVVTASIPVGYKLTSEAINAYRNKTPMTTTYLHTGAQPESCDAYYVSGIYDKNHKLLTKNFDKAEHIVLSYKHNVVNNTVNTTKMAIPGSGMVKGLVINNDEKIPAGIENQEEFFQKNQIDFVIHPNMLKGTKYNPASGTLQGQTLDSNILEIPLTVVEDNSTWNKGLKLKETDNITITNGRTAAEGMLTVGKYTFEVKDGKLNYDSVGVAKIESLLRSKYAKEYNSTNAARVHKIMQVAAIVNEIPKAEWDDYFKGTDMTKQDFINNIAFNTEAGSDVTDSVINTLIKKFFNGERLTYLQDKFNNNPVLRTIFSVQTDNNFSNRFLDGVIPVEGGVKNKQNQTSSISKENTRTVKGSVAGKFANLLEYESSGIHDNTSGFYDMLSYFNDLLISIDPEASPIHVSTARQATKDNVVSVANQYAGSQANGFNAINELDGSLVPMSLMAARGTTKTDFPDDETPILNKHLGASTVLTDAQITAYGKTKEKDNRHLPRGRYNNPIDLSEGKRNPALHNRQVLSYLVGIMKNTGSSPIEIAEAFNNNYPNVIVNSSPRTVIGNNGELQVNMIPETEIVPLRKAASTLSSKLTPTDFYMQQEARTVELREKIAQNDIAKQVDNRKTLDEKIQEFINETENLNSLVNPYAFKDTDRYKELNNNITRMEEGLDGYISEPERRLFQQLFDLNINNKKLKRSWFRSSGVKGSFATDRALVNYSNNIKMYLSNLAGVEYGALVKTFSDPIYQNNYKEFNKMVYGMLYMDKLDKATENLKSSKKSSISKDVWTKAQDESFKFFKDNFGITKLSEINKVKQDIELFAKTNSKAMSTVQTLLSRISALQAELDRAEGKPEGMAFTLLVDKAVAKEVRENKMLSRNDITVLDMADEKIDVLNTIGQEMDFLAKRAAVLQYTNLLKQDGRMANIPVIAKATQLTDEVLDFIRQLPEDRKSVNYDKESKLVEAVIYQALDLVPSIPKELIASTISLPEKLAFLYEQLRDDINRYGSIPYTDLVAKVMNDPDDIEAKAQLDKIVLLNNIMGTISYTASRATKGDARNKVIGWFTTNVFDSFIEDLDTSRYTLVDSNGRMLFKTNKDGSISFSDIYSAESMPFLTIEDACVYMCKYDKDALNNPDDKANQDEIKFNIVAGMLSGDVYVTDRVIAEEFGKSQLGLFPTKSMPVKVYKKIAQKIRNIKSSLLMSNPIRLIDRIVSQHAFDFGTFARNDLGAFSKIPQAKREINQVRASKGASMSETMRLFMDATGYTPGSRKIAGESNLEAINMDYFKYSADLFNTQHFESRYAAFLSLYEAALANGGNIPSKKAGSAYYMLEEINNYNPKNVGLSEEENFKHNVATKCMAVIGEAIGTSGDMPGIARDLGEYGFMFTTFPLACMRGGVGKLKSLGYAIWDSFSKATSTTRASSRKYLLAQTGNMLAATAITFLVTLLTSEGQEALELVIDGEENTEEEDKQLWETIEKYFFSGATIQPVQSVLNEELSGSEYQNTSIGAALYNMFVDPYVEAYTDDDETTNAGTASWRVLMENFWSHAPAGKDIIESIPSNNTLQSLETYSNEDNTFYENFFRKIGGYVIGSAPTNAGVNSYKADTYTDREFLTKLQNGFTAAVQEAFGNNKQSKSDWRTYTKASSIIYNYRVMLDYDYSGSDDWDDDLYSSIKQEYTLLMKTGKSPQDIYDLIYKHLDDGVPVAYVRSAVRNCSLAYKIAKFDQDDFINYLSDTELNVIKQALAYEKLAFPFLDDAISDLNDIYEEEADQNYYDTYGHYPTPITNAITQARYLLNYYKAYNSYSNYNNYRYNRSYTPYSNNYYRRNSYSSTPLDLFKSIQSNREYQQRQYEYQRNQRRWNN